MKKIIIIAIVGIALSGIVFLIIQNVTHQKYLGIEITGLKEEYAVGESIQGKVILNGYWALCGTFNIEFEGQGRNSFYDCIADAKPSQLNEVFPFVFSSNEMQPGTYSIKASFNKKITEKTIIIKNSPNEKQKTRIELSFGKQTESKLLPFITTEITTNAQYLDNITVWNFEMIGHSGDDRGVVWDTVPKNQILWYEISDEDGKDPIDRSRMPENWAVPSDLHIYQMDCGLFHTVEGESAHPTSFPINQDTSTVITKNTDKGIYPNSSGEYSFEFASIFETSVKLPDGAKIISQESKDCKLTQNIEEDLEGKYTDGYYIKMVFRLE